jgi:hypothetical protein
MNRARCVSAFLALLPWVAMAGPPEMKAKVGEPVVQELMGGCSLKCAFHWNVEAQSLPGQKPVEVKVLNDENADTAWFAPDGTTGVGAKLRLLFPKKLSGEMDGQVPLLRHRLHQWLLQVGRAVGGTRAGEAVAALL